MREPKIEEINRADCLAPLCPWCNKRGDPTEFMRHDHNVEIITECPYCYKKYSWDYGYAVEISKALKYEEYAFK